jgi:NAD(P)-dependent dehydrogenase (short-subunit alcohol dehydrogenase family)
VAESRGQFFKIRHSNFAYSHRLITDPSKTNLKGSLIAVKSLLPTANPAHATVIGYTAAITFPATMLTGLSAYGISKLAIVKLMEYIAAENPSIFTAALHPGMVETEIFKGSGTDPAAVPLDSGMFIQSFFFFFFTSVNS